MFFFILRITTTSGFLETPRDARCAYEAATRDDMLSAMAEQELEEMRQEVINEISIQHPITFQSYNICEMAATSKLSKFSIAMLEEICKYFELDTCTIK